MLQEVFAAAFNAMIADERALNVRPWLYRIARNRSLNHLRRVQAIGVDSMDVHLSENGASAADKVHRREEFRLLWTTCRSCPRPSARRCCCARSTRSATTRSPRRWRPPSRRVKSLLVRARVSLAEAAEARQLTCDEVRDELGEVAEGLHRTTAPVRRHLRHCDRCAAFRKQLRATNRALAAVFPVGAAAAPQEGPARAPRHDAPAPGGSAAAAGAASARGRGRRARAACCRAGLGAVAVQGGRRAWPPPPSSPRAPSRSTTPPHRASAAAAAVAAVAAVAARAAAPARASPPQPQPAAPRSRSAPSSRQARDGQARQPPRPPGRRPKRDAAAAGAADAPAAAAAAAPAARSRARRRPRCRPTARRPVTPRRRPDPQPRRRRPRPRRRRARAPPRWCADDAARAPPPPAGGRPPRPASGRRRGAPPAADDPQPAADAPPRRRPPPGALAPHPLAQRRLGLGLEQQDRALGRCRSRAPALRSHRPDLPAAGS